MSAIVVIILGAVLGLFVCLELIHYEVEESEHFLQEAQNSNIAKRNFDICQDSGFLTITGTKSISNLGLLISRYAALYGYAQKYQNMTQPVLPKTAKEKLLHLFQDLSIPHYNEECETSFYCQIDAEELVPKLFKGHECNVRIYGKVGLNALAAFHPYRSRFIEAELVVNNCYKLQAEQFLKRRISATSILVGVQIRRNGYEDFLRKARREGGFALSKAYYISAMEYFKQKFGHQVLFIVTTDDNHWAQEAFKDVENVIFTGTIHDKDVWQYIDFAILQKCHHSIISYGAFGFWSAYLRPTGITLFVDNSYQIMYYNTSILNTVDTAWIPWKDPCVEKQNGKWIFKENPAKHCVK